MKGNLGVTACCLLVAGVLATGCGSDNDSTTDGGATTAAAAVTSAATTSADAGSTETTKVDGPITGEASGTGYALQTTPEDTAAAEKSGTEAAAGEVLPKPTGKKIGFIHFDGQSTSSKRVLDGIKDAAAAMGDTVIACDPAGDTQKTKQCGTSLVAQGSDLIISYQKEPLELGGALKDAQSRGIPWVNVGEAVTPASGIRNYVADDPLVQKTLDDWLIPKMQDKAGSDTPSLLAFGAPQVGHSAKQQGDQLVMDMEGAGVDIVVNHDLDLANLEQDTLATVQQTVQQHPDLTAVWTICDFCVPIIAQGLRSTPEDQRPLVTGNYSTKATVDGIRKGDIAGIVDVAWEQFGWVALDQANRLWAAKKQLPETNVVFDYPIPLAKPYVLDENDVGTAGPVPIYAPDYPAFFKAKWAAEYEG